jgi:hypothetical protein
MRSAAMVLPYVVSAGAFAFVVAWVLVQDTNRTLAGLRGIQVGLASAAAGILCTLITLARFPWKRPARADGIQLGLHGGMLVLVIALFVVVMAMHLA